MAESYSVPRPDVPMPQTRESKARTALTRVGFDFKGHGFRGLLSASVGLSLFALFFLLYGVTSDGIPVLAERGWDFLSSPLSADPSRTGVWQGLKGTIQLVVFILVFAVPVGMASAVYLEEYAEDTWFTRFVSLNIRNLAGVPSVVYGILGLSVFVKFLGDFTGGRSVISAGFTLSILVLPLVIIAAMEALRAVPQSHREGAFGLGATRWEVIRHQVIPYAMPGIATGIVLSVLRALGETAPLILVGAVSGFFTTGDQNVVEDLQGPFTALPMLIFSWARQPKAEFEELTSAVIVVTLFVLLLSTLAAVLVRNRFEKRRQG